MVNSHSGIRAAVVSLCGAAALAAATATAIAQQVPIRDPKLSREGDPYKNSLHPLRDPNSDPGEGWGPDDPRVEGTGVRMDSAKADWPWGELFYGKSYPAPLEITNDCPSAEPVSIFVKNLPYLNIQRIVSIPAKSKLVVTGTITTPAPPKILLTGHEKLPHGIFVDVKGSVVVWHAFRPGVPPCMPNRVEYTVAGHVHYDPNGPPDDKRGPEKIGGATPCQVWWNTGERPRQAADMDCTEEMRGLATEYRSRVLQPLAERDAARWSWLPDAALIQQMEIGQLLSMKARAQALIDASR